MECLSSVRSVDRRQALRALRKGSIALKAGTRDAGPPGPTAFGPCRLSAAVRSAPGRSTECAFYRVFRQKRKLSAGFEFRVRSGALRLDRSPVIKAIRPDFAGGQAMTAAFVFPGQGSQAV